MPYSTPTAVVIATGTVSSLVDMIAQRRERLCMQCRSPLHPTQLAALVYSALVDEGPGHSLTHFLPAEARLEKAAWAAKRAIAPPLMPAPHAIELNHACKAIE
jgi:hypothetical protein